MITVQRAADIPASAKYAQRLGNGTYQVWESGDTVPATPAPTLADIKAARIEADREECRRRLVEQYGDALEQISRQVGWYGIVAQENHATGVQAAVDASNAARDAIIAATTVAQVEAVIVAWPVLP